MEIIIKGMLMASKKKDVEKNGEKKTYYSLDVYGSGRLYTIGVPLETYIVYKEKVNDYVEIKDISIWAKGNYSLYIKA